MMIMVITISFSNVVEIRANETTNITVEQGDNFIKFINSYRAVVHTEVVINAPVEDVWEVLMDFENLDWSPTFRGFEGELTHGSDVVALINVGEQVIELPIQLVWYEGKRFGWRGENGFSGPELHDNHMFVLNPIDENTTLFMQTDDSTVTDLNAYDFSNAETQAYMTFLSCYSAACI